MANNHILEYTFNDFFFQELLESVLSLETKRELIEYLWANQILTNKQYKMSIERVDERIEVNRKERMRNRKGRQSKKIIKR